MRAVADHSRKAAVQWQKSQEWMPALAKAQEKLGESLPGFSIWSHSVSMPAFVVAMSSQHRWRDDVARDVGRAILGRRLALPGPMGCCALAHIIHLVERAARRALFLPQEGALCSYKEVKMSLLTPAERREFPKSMDTEWQTLLKNQAAKVSSLEERAPARER